MLLYAILLGNTALPINLGLDVVHHRHILYLFSDLVVVYIQGQALGLVMRLPKPKKKNRFCKTRYQNFTSFTLQPKSADEWYIRILKN